MICARAVGRHIQISKLVAQTTPLAQFATQALPFAFEVGDFASLVARRPRLDARSRSAPLLHQELYHAAFHEHGVTVSHFEDLIRCGSLREAPKRTIILQGGVQNPKVVLILRGTAMAYRHIIVQDVVHHHSDDAVCAYIGRLEEDRDHEGLQRAVPSRGSVIGGSALADKSILSKPYPTDIVALTELQWIEWNLTDLQELLAQDVDLRAGFVSLLYEELLATLDKDRRSRAMLSGGEVKLREPPSTGQLCSWAIFVAVPFIGFGFADNLIMIVAGDAIDSHLGVSLGLSTLAAAGLGNWMSDAVGLGLGDAIERWAQRLGLHDGRLSPAQEKLRVTRLTTSFAKFVGISLGCFGGMAPLLFMSPKGKE